MTKVLPPPARFLSADDEGCKRARRSGVCIMYIRNCLSNYRGSRTFAYVNVTRKQDKRFPTMFRNNKYHCQLY